MTINEYIKRWCEEDYDVKYEDFYVENAKWTIEKEWYYGGIGNGILSILICGAFAFFNHQKTR